MNYRRFFAVIVAFAFGVARAGADASYRVDPSSKRILGLSVNKLDREWELASLVDASNLPPLARDDLAGASDPAFSFVVEGDFNHDARPDKAVVGVYRTRGGKEGQFLLVLTRNSRGTWVVGYVSKYEGFPGPSLLYRLPAGVYWTPCTACDFGATVSWVGDHYETAWEEADDDSPPGQEPSQPSIE